MASKKRKGSTAYLPPSPIPRFRLEALSVSGGIEAAIGTLMHSPNDDQGAWIIYTLSKQIPDVIAVLLASEFLLRPQGAAETDLPGVFR